MENENNISPLSVGDKVPNLKLSVYHDGKDKAISLDDYKDKWKIFFFYPADFTFICPTELEEMATYYEKFQKENVEIFSVSTDTVFVHKAWHDQSPAIGKIKFPMVADPSHELCKMFNTYIDDEKNDDYGLSTRGTFIINPENIIKSIEINDNSIGRSAKETFRKLLAAKYVSENNGKVCPASWNPGDDDLEPGMNLVGKI